MRTLPSNSFRSLLDDLATLCLNKVSLPSNPSYRFDMPTAPIPLRARAFELLGVSMPCSQSRTTPTADYRSGSTACGFGK